MNKNYKEGLSIVCPTCEALPGKRCELNIGGLRNSSHLDRCWAELGAGASGKKKKAALGRLGARVVADSPSNES
jgi:hypothetical protein